MWFDVDFGTGSTSLAVGVTQIAATGLPVVARTTTGVVEIGNGLYGADLALDPTSATVVWDTGEVSPVYAMETIATASIAPATAAAVWAYVTRTLTANPGVTTAEIVTALQATTIPVDVQLMNSNEVIGTGTTGDAWRGVGVSP